MSYSRIILQDSTSIVWPLDDIDLSASISKPISFYSENEYSFSASINIDNSNVMFTPIIFGGGTALSLTSSAVGLSLPALGLFSELYNNKNSCIEFWFQPSELNRQERVIFKKRNFDNISLLIKDNYLIFKYGTDSRKEEVSAPIDTNKDPIHIVIGKNNSGLTMIVNGQDYYKSISDPILLPEDPNHSDNDVIDFYGPDNSTWVVDCVAYYSNIISISDAKRHYVYGLGKNIGNDVFYHRGGEFYNLSTIDTEKLFSINWEYSYEWLNTTLNNLKHKENNLSTDYFSDPEIYSYDTNINTASNSVIFRSDSANARAAYIDIKKLNNKFESSNNPFFIKIKLDGPLPVENNYQRIFTYGQIPGKDILTFDLYNNSASYQILISSSYFSVEFNIEDIENQPEVYLGMQFLNQSLFYFAQSGSAVQTASFNYYNNDGFGIDPMSSFFPLLSDAVFRIGSNFSYDKDTFSDNYEDVHQFLGTFEKFSIHSISASSTLDTFETLESYNKFRYSVSYDSSLDRFKTFAYGDITFNIHGIDIGEFVDDSTNILGSNIVSIGYPDIQSSSQVQIYVTQLDYDDVVINPRTQLNQTNYINFINNVNIFGTYLKFDIEIYAEDTSYYPPIVKYFNMETYKNNNGSTVLRNDSGVNYTIHPTSSSVIFLPEIKRTPTSYLTDSSGIKVNSSYVDFSENISPRPLNPVIIPNLVAWYDSRFINGLGRIQPQDDSLITQWNDLSGNDYHLVQSDSASAPTFRIQSLNILTNNQGNGAESGDLSNIIAVNGTASSTVDGAVSGYRGIQLIPDGSSVDSYIELGRNTASFTLAPDQSYSVVGSIKLLRPQTASYLHDDARKIVIYTTDGVVDTLTASTTSASNLAGTYNLYAEFTTGSALVGASIRAYNGSFDSNDIVYWDNIAVYAKQSGSYISSWITPLTSNNDMPVVKFNGLSSIQGTASADPVLSWYKVSRNWGDVSPESSITVTSGSYTVSSINFGAETEDISAYVLYNRIHTNEESELIQDWLTESFNLIE